MAPCQARRPSSFPDESPEGYNMGQTGASEPICYGVRTQRPKAQALHPQSWFLFPSADPLPSASLCPGPSLLQLHLCHGITWVSLPPSCLSPGPRHKKRESSAQGTLHWPPLQPACGRMDGSPGGGPASISAAQRGRGEEEEKPSCSHFCDDPGGLQSLS
jgi:hypothetical protein